MHVLILVLVIIRLKFINLLLRKCLNIFIKKIKPVGITLYNILLHVTPIINNNHTNNQIKYIKSQLYCLIYYHIFVFRFFTQKGQYIVFIITCKHFIINNNCVTYFKTITSIIFSITYSHYTHSKINKR